MGGGGMQCFFVKKKIFFRIFGCFIAEKIINIGFEDYFKHAKHPSGGRSKLFCAKSAINANLAQNN
jgi:hypothetical protein